MRALAEFIMRGRLQASLVALAGNLVPLISPATVGLVTLRRSYQDGLLVLWWACLPLLLALYFASASHLLVMTSLAGMFAVFVTAQVLKESISWQVALVAALAVCGFLMIALGLFFPAQMTVVTNEVQAVMASLDELQESTASPFYVLMAVMAMSLGIEQVTLTYVVGFLAWLTVMHVVGSVLISRWWQSLLYNPGGFQQEFHNLRLSTSIALPLMIAVVACNLLPPEYMTWGSMLGIPLLLAGIGLVHYLVKARSLGTFFLVFMYVGLILFGPLSMVLIVVGLLDSFMNFRVRLARP